MRVIHCLFAFLIGLCGCSVEDAGDVPDDGATASDAADAALLEAFRFDYTRTDDEAADRAAYATGCTIGGSEFARLRETFGAWRVRHVYDEASLRHRFSDARTRMSIGEVDFRAQINCSPEGEFTFHFVYAFGRVPTEGAAAALRWLRFDPTLTVATRHRPQEVDA